MKAEINNENKAKFFALYFNQYVGRNPLNGNNKSYVSQHFLNVSGIGCASYLFLKPLSSISNEDAIDLEYQYCNDPLNANYGMSPSGCLFDDWTQREEMLMSDSDFLRSKGYALPWMGLSVEELIEAGWIKLTQI